jgi:hypothetical protein
MFKASKQYRSRLTVTKLDRRGRKQSLETPKVWKCHDRNGSQPFTANTGDQPPSLSTVAGAWEPPRAPLGGSYLQRHPEVLEKLRQHKGVFDPLHKSHE